MNCLKCAETLKEKKVRMRGEYAGETFTVETEALVCEACGYKTMHATKLDKFRRRLADAYRETKGLLTSQEIRKVRERLKMSQEQFAPYLGVGVASVKRWELGQAQERSMDQLIRLRSNRKVAEENFRDLLLRYGGDSDEFSGYSPFDIEKLANAILFFLEAAAKESRKLTLLTLNKLLWYADVEQFQKYATSITGTRYARLPYGPVPDDYTLIYRDLEKLGYIGSHQDLQLKPLRPFESTCFSDIEIASLKRVWQRFHKKLNQIVRQSHTEPAWKETPHAQLISFKKV